MCSPQYEPHSVCLRIHVGVDLDDFILIIELQDPCILVRESQAVLTLHVDGLELDNSSISTSDDVLYDQLQGCCPG